MAYFVNRKKRRIYFSGAKVFKKETFLYFSDTEYKVKFGYFFSVFFIKRIVSISSILMSVIASGLSFIPFVYKGFYLYPQTFGLYYSIVLVAISALLVIRHKSNIVKLIKGEEKKFAFAKK